VTWVNTPDSAYSCRNDADDPIGKK